MQKTITVTPNPAIDTTLYIPSFAAGKVNRVENHESYAGGKGVNVASFLSDLGFSVTVTGFAGTDNIDIFEKLFKSKKINDRFIRVPGKTRNGIKIINPDDGETTDINFPGLCPSGKAVEQLIREVSALSSPGRWIVFSGSLPKGVRSDLYSICIRTASDKGAYTALDTSGTVLSETLNCSAPTLIKPNISELEEYLGKKLTRKTDLIKAVNHLLKKNIRYVIVSMGDEGAIFTDGGCFVRAVPGKVDIVSTVGAGDAMVAGCVSSLCAGHDIKKCAIRSTAMAMIAVNQVKPGIDDMNRLREFEHMVSLETI